jgi:type III restriction enzyme
VNYVVADTRQWEQSAAYYLDTHPGVDAFVKNAGLGLGIPYLMNGSQHEFVPDFVIRLAGPVCCYLILETKGHDPAKEIKRSAAMRWCAAVNGHGEFGQWQFVMVDRPEKVNAAVSSASGFDC